MLPEIIGEGVQRVQVPRTSASRTSTRWGHAPVRFAVRAITRSNSAAMASVSEGGAASRSTSSTTPFSTTSVAAGRAAASALIRMASGVRSTCQTPRAAWSTGLTGASPKRFCTCSVA
jgi:hypothetical protein